MVSIQPKEYKELKEYWDFQRKKEYNKEKVMKMCESFGGRLYDQFGPIPLQEVKDTIWSKIPQSEYEDPPEEWIPEDPNYRLWWETGDLDSSKLSKKAQDIIKGSLTKSKNSI